MATKGPVRGAYEIKELVMVDFQQKNQIDLANHVQSLFMHESIYQPYLTLDIIVEDTTALHEQVPFLGEEMIFFTWVDAEGVRDGNRSFRKIFYVTSVTAMKDHKPTAQTYTIKACSPEYFQSKKVKVYGGWNTTEYSEIAKDVYDNWIARPLSKKFKGYEKRLDIERTKGSYNFCCPGWEPIQTLEWLASKSVSSIKGTTGALYFFWESMHGLHFKSLETILQRTNELQETESQAAMPQIHLVPANIGGGVGGTTQAYDQNVPDEHFWPQMFNSADKLEKGMIANRVVGLDFIHQSVLNYDYFYDQQGKTNGHAYKTNTLNSSVSFLNPDADQTTKQGKFPVVSVAAVSGSGDDRAVNYQSGEGFSRMHRTSQLEQIQQLQLEAMVPYNAEYETGSLCYVFIPSRAGTQDSSLNGLTSGKYLITGMEHLLLGGLWKLRVKLVKESLLQNIDDALNLSQGDTENVDKYTGKPVAGGVSTQQPKRVSAQNASLDPLDEETYKQTSFHENVPPEVGPSSS